MFFSLFFFVYSVCFQSLLPLGFIGHSPAVNEAAKGGDWLLVCGQVKNSTGEHLPYATIDVWQTAPDGQTPK
jgi:protocatechuate 3,4-dioxygenase beta subunit